ncbi:MAG: lysine--tRNA ligase [Pseudanabaenaceae cyanobacterium]
MFWADKWAEAVTGTAVVNDSKTPSGRVHVGSLRGVIIHDVIYRAIQYAGKPVKFYYGVDDYDALDTVPKYLPEEQFKPYLGFPLCNVPAPNLDGRPARSYADYFMDEFLGVFNYLGVKPEIYYLHDLYRQGKLNYHIDLFLRHASDIRAVYKEVSKSDRPDNWYPFHPICENCGKIATTVTTAYEDGKVFYTCTEDSTNYVKGCGYQGWVSPFDGRGKLPWKVEWVAKWAVIGVTIELAGKDHSQKGGSRDVANAICRRVLGKEPPFHAPYEFILVNGTKMSSSKGVGASAKEIAELLPPELLRFLMLRTMPRTVINFQPNYETTTRLFRDYDTLQEKYKNDPNLPAEELAPLRYAQLGDEILIHPTIELSTIISLLQIPHLDIEKEVRSRLQAQGITEISEADWQHIQERIRVARHWLQNYADEEEKLVIYWDRIPPRTEELSPLQKQYLQTLAERVKSAEWEGEHLQNIIFATCKEVDISQKEGFAAVYLAFLNKEKGPKAGHLFSYMERQFVIDRLQAVSR